MNKTNDLVRIAERNLTTTPFDIGHDTHHHYNVWVNAYTIMALENLTLDIEKLNIACWWHDYERGSTKHPVLVENMKNLKYADSYIQDVLKIINSHSFEDDKSPEVEAKVLFDADKIEYVNPGRYFWVGEGILNGKIELNIARKYGKNLTDRIEAVAKQFNYVTSKEMFTENLQKFILLFPSMTVKYGDFLADVNVEVLKSVYKSVVE